MADGTTKSIEQVKEGDLALSRSESGDESGAVVAKRVVRTMVHEAPATLVLTLSSGEVIETTGEHPFYVSGKGFIEAKDLGIGTSLVTRAGPQVAIVGIEGKERAATVYNFSVEETHTYFVGAHGGGVWVHNKPDLPEIPGNPAKRFEGPDGPDRAFEHLRDNHGVPPDVASNRLHKLKEQGYLAPDDDVIIGPTGDVYDARDHGLLGSLTDKSLGR